MEKTDKLIKAGLFLFMASLLVGGCSVQKFIPEDKYLLIGSEVTVESPANTGVNELRNDLNSLASRRSNNKVIGLPIGVYYHYKYHDDPEMKGIFNKLMRTLTNKLQRPPVYYDENAPSTVAETMEATATNLGYFTNEASFEIDTNQRKKEISVRYNVEVGQAYRLEGMEYALEDSALMAIAEYEHRKTRIKPGKRYDLSRLKQERQRLQNEIRERGYFFFNADDLEFLADTSDNEFGVKLLLKLKDDVAQSHLQPQRIAEIVVYDDMRRQDSTARDRDHLEFEGIKIICDTCTLLPRAVDDIILMKPGDTFSPLNHERTLHRIGSYQTFRYYSLGYEPLPGSDSLLRLNAFLSPLLPKRIEGEIGGAFNSGEYFGPELSLSYTQRNLFGGGEYLKVQGDVALAFFLGDRDQSRVPNTGTYELSTTLNIPRLLIPGRDRFFRNLRSRSTIAQIGGSLESLQLNLNRFGEDIEELQLTELQSLLEQDSTVTPNVSLIQIFTQFGYTWQRGKATRHAFDPFALQFQNPVTESDELLILSRSIGLAQGQQNLGRLDRMVLFYPGYTYVYDSRLNRIRTHNFFFSQYISMNFNTVSASEANSMVTEKERSRYPQVESDLRYYLKLGNNTTIATRLHAGIAFPLKGRVIVPYSRLYSVGGANSLRGFIPRGIGPGGTPPDDNNLLTFGGYGNVLIEASMEWRQELGSLFEIALFADAGNVWTYKTSDRPLDSDISTERFFRELGMNVGAGVRLDFDFLIFRVDVAKPILLPYEPDPDIPADRSPRLVFGFGHPF